MTTMGEKLSEEDVDEMMKAANIHDEDNLDYEKFIAMMVNK